MVDGSIRRSSGSVVEIGMVGKGGMFVVLL